MSDKAPTKTGAERSAAHRRKVIDEGGRWLSILLKPEPAKALERLCDAAEAPASVVITDLIEMKDAALRRRRR